MGEYEENDLIHNYFYFSYNFISPIENNSLWTPCILHGERNFLDVWFHLDGITTHTAIDLSQWEATSMDDENQFGLFRLFLSTYFYYFIYHIYQYSQILCHLKNNILCAIVKICFEVNLNNHYIENGDQQLPDTIFKAVLFKIHFVYDKNEQKYLHHFFFHCPLNQQVSDNIVEQLIN